MILRASRDVQRDLVHGWATPVRQFGAMGIAFLQRTVHDRSGALKAAAPAWRMGIEART
jgi:hypothetical protein